MMTAPGEMLATNPFLLSLTLPHLSKSDLATCLRVNIAFFDIAGPLLYRDLDIDCSKSLTALDRAGPATRRRKKTEDRIRSKQLLLDHTEIITLRNLPRQLEGRWAGDQLSFPKLKALRLYGFGEDSAGPPNRELDAIKILRPEMLVIRPRTHTWTIQLNENALEVLFESIYNSKDDLGLKRIILVDLECENLLGSLYKAQYSGCEIPITVVLPHTKSDQSDDYGYKRFYCACFHQQFQPIEYNHLTLVHADILPFSPYPTVRDFWTKDRPNGVWSRTNPGEWIEPSDNPVMPTFTTFTDFMATQEGRLSFTPEDAVPWYEDEKVDQDVGEQGMKDDEDDEEDDNDQEDEDDGDDDEDENSGEEDGGQ